DEKFGDAAPNLSACRTALSEMKQVISDIWDKKKPPEPKPTAAADLQSGTSSEPTQQSGSTDPLVLRFPLSLLNMQGSQSALGGSWQDAEALVRSGQVEKG